MGGKSGGSTVIQKVKPPKAPPPPPTQVDARSVAARRRGYAGNKVAANIKNIGSGRGVSTADAETALRKLTGKA